MPGGRTMHLAITSARLELAHGQPGTVLVVEDTTELLRAQRQLAWKEVAQRVAHEIKNPLTPIALSAERIGRHLDRGQPDSPAVIRKCSEVILGCVGTLRTLVDQFSALAQFPAPQPRACDMNKWPRRRWRCLPAGWTASRCSATWSRDCPWCWPIPRRSAARWPTSSTTPPRPCRAACCACSALRSSLSEDGAAVEIAVSDTGHGLTDEIRERLFLPFYSTKHRGTGLGLSIAAKIVQEHGGCCAPRPTAPRARAFCCGCR